MVDSCLVVEFILGDVAVSKYYLYQDTTNPEYFYLRKEFRVSWACTKKGNVKSVIGTITKLNLVGLSLIGCIKDSQLEMYLTLNPEMTIGALITILEA